MRTIIIIQTLIIIAGGFYIYTLSKEPKAEVKTEAPAIVTPPENIKNLHPGYVPPTENPPAVEATASGSKAFPGNSDAGMEYPIMDADRVIP